MNQYKTEILILIFIGIAIFTLVNIYFYFPSIILSNLASYLSGFSTVGILILTSFYVFYTNKQIKVLQKQHQLSIQPLPTIEIKDAKIMKPRLVHDIHHGSEISLKIELVIKYKIKNLGNGTAIMIDIFFDFIGKKYKEKKSDIYAHRINTLESGAEIVISESLEDDKCLMLKILNTSGGVCPVNSAFNILVSSNILYRNALYSSFLTSIDHLIAIDEANQKKISDWLSIISSYKAKFSEDIAKYEATLPRNKEEAFKIFCSLEDKISSKFKEDGVKVKLLPFEPSFDIAYLNENEANKISSKINHGIPVE